MIWWLQAVSIKTRIFYNSKYLKTVALFSKFCAKQFTYNPQKFSDANPRDK